MGITEPDLTNPRAWASMIEAAGPASLLFVIESRMGPALRERMTSEDVWQETLLHAWRDRETCRAATPREFRSWLLTVIDHRVLEAVDHFAAIKRGGAGFGSAHDESSKRHRVGSLDSADPALAATTTPSRLASLREQAAIMRQAIAGLDEEVREVVRLRLFEQSTISTIAQRLGIGQSAVRHRFRQGVERYHELLRTALASRGATMMSIPALGELDSSSVRGTPRSTVGRAIP